MHALYRLRRAFGALLNRQEDEVKISATCMRESEFYRRGDKEDGVGRMIHFDQRWFVVESHASEGARERHYFIYCATDIVVNITVDHHMMEEALAELKADRVPPLFRSIERLQRMGEQYMSEYKGKLKKQHSEQEVSFADPFVVVISIGNEGHVTVPPKLLL